MKTHDLTDDSGRIFAFEIENTFVGRGAVVHVARTIPGCTIKRIPLPFSWFCEDSFCEFEVDGERYVAEELHGDNSRYWIGPKMIAKADRWRPQTAKVRKAFRHAKSCRIWSSW